MTATGRIGTFLLTVLTMFFTGTLWAQQYDSTFYPADSNAVLYFHNQLDIYSPLKLTPADTSLYGFERYDPLNRKYFFNASLGNVGLAYKLLNFTFPTVQGFDYGIHAFDVYLFNNRDIKYFVNPRPYTEVAYTTGAKKEQLFSVVHDQRVFRRLTIGLNFNLINSLGSYQRQKSDNHQLAAKIHYFTEDLRYGIIANYTHSKVKVRENGGILHDSIYEQNLEPTRSIIPIHLQNAQNLLRESGVYLQQYFQLSRKEKSFFSDSTKQKRIRLRFGRIAHSFNYKRYSQVYTDLTPDINYYPAVHVDSAQTYDSVFYQVMENSLSWSNSDYLNRIRPQPFVVLFGIKYQIASVNDTLLKSTYQNLIPYGTLEIRPFPSLEIKADGSYILSGDVYKGDFTFRGAAVLDILKKKPYKTGFHFTFDLDNHAAPYFYRHYFSNHFWWDNNMSKVKTRKISAFVTQRNLTLGVDIFRIKDYIYISTDTLPAQFNEPVEIYKFYLYQQFHIGKFDINGRFIFQQVSNKTIIRLPAFMAYFTATFNLQMFKGALKTHSGFDVYYNTKYYAEAYMPAIRSFYLQDAKKIGNFFYIDFFIDFNVKRARFFLKLQNLLSVFGYSHYYAVPHYPLQDMALKFGVSWRFHD